MDTQTNSKRLFPFSYVFMGASMLIGAGAYALKCTAKTDNENFLAVLFILAAAALAFIGIFTWKGDKELNATLASIDAQLKREHSMRIDDDNIIKLLHTSAQNDGYKPESIESAKKYFNDAKRVALISNYLSLCTLDYHPGKIEMLCVTAAHKYWKKMKNA